jgi:uncharacterized protein YkwD
MSLQHFDHTLLSRAIFQATNLARVANRKPPLAPLPALDNAADMQANYMALSLAAGHSSIFPNQHDVAERVARAGLHAASVGENTIMEAATRPPDAPKLDYTYREYASFLVDKWMQSPDHRSALLSPKFTELGCAARLARGFRPGDLRIFATQVFFLPDPG